MRIRIIIADDHPVVREGLRASLGNARDIEIVGEAADGNEVLKLAETLNPDVVVMDLTMPGMNGIEATRRLVSNRPEAKIVILSIHNRRGYAEKALESGAQGYVLKDNPVDLLLQAIRTVHSGGRFLCPEVAHYFDAGEPEGRYNPAGYPRDAKLTARETEILQLLGEGHAAAEIADRLNIAANTVINHRKNMMQKLDIHKQADLVRYAIREGFSKP